MEPEQVLELIRSAPERYESVRAALRYRGDGPVHKEIRERIVRSEAGRQAFQVSPGEASEPIRHPEPDGPFGWSCRAWHADQYHWRMETEVPGGGVAISASKGRRRLPIGGPPGSGLVWDRRDRSRTARGRPAMVRAGPRSLLDLLPLAHGRDLRDLPRTTPPGSHGKGPGVVGGARGCATRGRTGRGVGLGVGSRPPTLGRGRVRGGRGYGSRRVAALCLTAGG